ncbi:MAG TPA: OmpA family protein [Candidatus Sulfotelmatobacter sp.]|nr:OmpA family protein [Candidatus Sulfotelmatobacter sp.]
MNRIVKTVCVVALLPFFGACSFMALDVPVGNPTATGSPFTQELTAGYRGLSNEQATEYDWVAAEVFAQKALRSAKGDVVLPEIPQDWTYRPGGNTIEPYLPELTEVRGRLLAKLDGGAREHDAVRAARAQVAYDCWVEEASEPNSADDMARCRATVMDFLKVVTSTARPTPPAETPEVYLVFFAFDKSDISAVASKVLDRVIADFHRTGSAVLDVQGYTDLAGSVDYNLKLSKRRADAVKAYLVAHGVQADEIRTEWFGKSNPRVPTPDGVRNQENRRAQIYLKK